LWRQWLRREVKDRMRWWAIWRCDEVACSEMKGVARRAGWDTIC
jgi:hypothetical protein